MVWLALALCFATGAVFGFCVCALLIAAGTDAARYDDFGK